MTTLQVTDRLSSLIHELEFNNAEEIIKSSLHTEILCRISGFSEEVEHQEEKYGEIFMTLKRSMKREKKTSRNSMILWHGNLPSREKNIGKKNWKN